MRQFRREDVTLNNLSLRGVDPKIINIRVIEPDATEDIGYAALPGRAGQRVTRRKRTSKKIQVQFGIRELYDLARRTEIIDAVNRWAQDGELMSTTRPERMAQVIVTKYAGAADVRDYNGAYTLEFEAAGVPYWQDAVPERLELTGTNAEGDILITGSAETVLDAVITPAAGVTLTAVEIEVTSADGGASNLTFTGLSATGPLTLTHDAEGLLVMSAGLLAARIPESDDDLFARPGSATVALTTSGTVSAVFRTRGRWR